MFVDDVTTISKLAAGWARIRHLHETISQIFNLNLNAEKTRVHSSRWSEARKYPKFSDPPTT
jgi:hypothetical protein